MKTKSKVCEKCGAKILAEGPGEFCSACALESALGAGDAVSTRSHGTTARPLMDFGDYELQKEIGHGGQGVVFRARQKSLNRTVALKVIALGHWATEEHLKRFRLEAEAAASLDHSCIVPIYEIGEQDGSCYFSMKLVEGGQLDEVVRQEPLSLRRAVELIAKLARTIHYAHEHGILHRDIKPGNILLDANGEPHLADFGLARLVETESTVTRTMEVLGTPSYMAPEQAAGQTGQLTSATDVYGLGAVFYQLLTGHPPFAGGTTYETIRLVLETEPRKPRLWNSKVDRDLETICLKCLEKDPKKRYVSALELAEDLDHWLRHEPIRARRSGIFTRSKKWMRRNPATAVLIPALAALAIAVGILVWKAELAAAPSTGIAVLPFDNLNDSKENAFFADGIQDDILTELAKVADLKVISRTSVMQYRGRRDVRNIGQILRVSHVLEGSVRKTDGRIRLNAQLIDTRTDAHVWAEQYDRDLTDVLTIQSELAQKIVSQLRANISSAEKTAIERKPTQDLEAYNLYLRAKELMHSTSTEETAAVKIFSNAVNLLEKAVARDPNFALAHCLLVEASLGLYCKLPHAPADRARADASLQAARRLAPEAGETHFAQALFYYWGNRDYGHALEALEMAARSLPNSAAVVRLSGQLERRLGRWTEAVRHFGRAVELDPRAWGHRAGLSVTYRLLRDYTKAQQIADRAIAALPEAADKFRLLKSQGALEQDDTKGARAALEAMSPGNSNALDTQWRIALFERNFAEAHQACATRSQDKNQEYFVYPSIFLEALTARAEGDMKKMRSSFLAARQAYEAQLRERPDDPQLFEKLGLVDAGLGRKEDALREARRAVELRPISRDAIEGSEDWRI